MGFPIEAYELTLKNLLGAVEMAGGTDCGGLYENAQSNDFRLELSIRAKTPDGKLRTFFEVGEFTEAYLRSVKSGKHDTTSNPPAQGDCDLAHKGGAESQDRTASMSPNDARCVI